MEKIFEAACKAIEPKELSTWACEYVQPEVRPYYDFYINDARYEEFKESAEYCGKDIYHSFVVKGVLLSAYPTGSDYFNIYYDFREVENGVEIAGVHIQEYFEDEE